MHIRQPLLISALLATLGCSAPVEKRGSGFVSMKLKHTNEKRASEKDTNPMDVTMAAALDPEELDNHISYYSVDVEIGNPPQQFSLHVDTGSSDLWVLDSSTGESPSFDTSKSNSYKNINQGFNINYLQGSTSGNWATDDISVSGVTLKDQQFGVATQQTAGKGIIGVGRQGLESTSQKYSNVPMSLKEQGAINSNAYSMFLDDVEASTGSILFGGVQPNKYKGTLYTVPMKGENTISVNVDGLIVNDDTSVIIPNGNFDTLVDSGTSLTYIEDSLAAAIAKRFDCRWYPQLKAYFCDNRDDSNTVTYSFSGAKVTVPASEVLIDGTIYGGSGAPGKYMLTIVPYSEAGQTTILGDSFLRGVYTVFDLDNKEVSFAQSSFDTSDGDVQVINGGIPGAQRAPNYQ